MIGQAASPPQKTIPLSPKSKSSAIPTKLKTGKKDQAKKLSRKKTISKAKTNISKKTSFTKTRSLPSDPNCLQNRKAVQLTHYATHESYCLLPTGNTFTLSPKQQTDINHLMRCHVTQKEGQINPKLIELMYQIASHYPSRKITIIAGYRAVSVAQQKGNGDSPHTVGNAADFFVEGVAPADLFDYIRSQYQQVSAIYYPNREPKEPNFIHLNPRSAGKSNWFKIDISRPGEKSNYQDPQPLPLNK